MIGYELEMRSVPQNRTRKSHYYERVQMCKKWFRRQFRNGFKPGDFLLFSAPRTFIKARINRVCKSNLGVIRHIRHRTAKSVGQFKMF
jgi:hypothetical protein